MGLSKAVRFALAFSTLACGCLAHHDAKVQTALLPPPSDSPARHTGRLWVELGDATWETQCRVPKGQRELCFAGVRRAMFAALSRGLWTSFPDVLLRDQDSIPLGDYLLVLNVSIDALAPDAAGPGWSAAASGGFRLSRDGKTLVEEKLGSRSRPSFAYGSALGVGAGEVVDAFATHVAQVLGGVPEDRPLRAAPLPAVVAESVGPRAPTPIAPAPIAPAMGPATEPALTGPVETAEPPAAPGVSLPTTPVAAR
mgnify:CR=1 FL=1